MEKRRWPNSEFHADVRFLAVRLEVAACGRRMESTLDCTRSRPFLPRFEQLEGNYEAVGGLFSFPLIPDLCLNNIWFFRIRPYHGAL